MKIANPASPSSFTPRSRLLSAVEFLVGAGVVIGHNVYHVIPNEVPILFVLGWISIRLRDGGWKAIGLTRPVSWKWTVGIALGVAALRIALGELVIQPIATRFLPKIASPSGASDIPHHPLYALLALAIVWTFAAFGEEMGYRGYLLTRGADFGKRTAWAYWIALIPVSVLFGYGHYYKGAAGMVDSGIAGLLLGGSYLLSRRNLWVPILAHGFIDTFSVIAAFLGFAN
ncbi:MAG: CPBP family intramembrane glutamic endopeptidase [Silvibacterium sp.]